MHFWKIGVLDVVVPVAPVTLMLPSKVTWGYQMANRALAAKVERAARQTRELAQHEFGKAFYLMATKPQVPAYNPLMVQRFPAGASSSERVRSGYDGKLRLSPGTAVRAASALARGCYK
jgi:hypothetical protein